jgi:ATP-dependent Clp protease ATP-binding subunit ClpC
MTREEFEKSLNDFRGAVLLESIVPHRLRRLLKNIIFVLVLIAFVLGSGIIVPPSASVTGLFFLLLSVWLIVVALDAFFYSIYFKARDEDHLFELALIVFAPGEDPVKSFITSPQGKNILMRLGVDDNTFQDYISQKKLSISKKDLVYGNEETLAAQYFNALLRGDEEFKNFLLIHNINTDLLLRTTELVFDLERKKLEGECWWNEDRLVSIKKIGRDWDYGEANTLARWSYPIRYSMDRKKELHAEEIKELETLISKSSGGNVLIVGEEGSGKLEVVEGLQRLIKKGETSPLLLDKKIYALDTVGISTSAPNKFEFEKLFIQLLTDTVVSGNIILVIPNLPALVMDARALSIDFSALIVPFLSSGNVNIIALSDQDEFNKVLESKTEILTHFEKLVVKGEDTNRVLTIFEDEINELETREGVIFSYPALLEAVQGAERYFVGTPLYSTASDLLLGSASVARQEGRKLVTKEDLLALIKTKTGVPTGDIRSEEKEKLINLESHMHERIVGQDEAISALSGSLRRSRAGISNPKRPIGSFLFLGPTGVGKTETAKALAEVFFGQDGKVLRLDMSEYNSPDALSRLIGAFDGENPGVLSSMIRENPYGVLLLDEFEKTDSRVLDLFLQIIDEGMFSDVLGRKVSARNIIIVATSNAGSQIIFDIVAHGGSLLNEKDHVIDLIVKDGVFKPELINRFDAVVLFHPLVDEHLKKVARLKLEELAWRLKEKGINLLVTDMLVDFLVSKGSDPKFGARPLNRAIQDTLEKVIADKIIAGDLHPGSELEFTKEDLSI